MKNLIIIVIIVLSSSVIFAANPPTDYITNTEGTIFVTNLKYGVFYFLKADLRNGEGTGYKKEEVIEYKKNGQVYTKLPEIVENSTTDNYVFMKLIKYNNGLKLYEYSKLNEKGVLKAELYIFDGREFITTFDPENYQHVAVFFFERLIDMPANAPR